LDESGHHLGGGWQDEHPTHYLVHLVEPELKARHYSEVPASATKGPEQVRLVLFVHLQDPPVGRHHFGGEKTVDGQAVLSDQETDPSAEGDPAQTDARRVAEPGREPVA